MTEKQPRPTYLVERTNGYNTPMNPTGEVVKVQDRVVGLHMARRDYDLDNINPQTGRPALMEAKRKVPVDRLSDAYQDKLAEELAQASPTYHERMAIIEQEQADAERLHLAKTLGSGAIAHSIESTDNDPFAHLYNVSDDDDGDAHFDVERAAIREPKSDADRLRREREKADADHAAMQAYKRPEMGWRG